jgi:hypothetical protein
VSLVAGDRDLIMPGAVKSIPDPAIQRAPLCTIGDLKWKGAKSTTKRQHA